jgi:hypothetical protein
MKTRENGNMVLMYGIEQRIREFMQKNATRVSSPNGIAEWRTGRIANRGFHGVEKFCAQSRGLFFVPIESFRDLSFRLGCKKDIHAHRVDKTRALTSAQDAKGL